MVSARRHHSSVLIPSYDGSIACGATFVARVNGPVLVHDSLKLYGIFESIVFEVRHPACEDVSDVRFYAIEGESHALPHIRSLTGDPTLVRPDRCTKISRGYNGHASAVY